MILLVIEAKRERAAVMLILHPSLLSRSALLRTVVRAQHVSPTIGWQSLRLGWTQLTRFLVAHGS
jgi:hypothetical protein